MNQSNNLPIFDKLIITYLIIQTLLLRWLIGKDVFKYVSLIIFIIILIRTFKKSQVKLGDVIFLGFYGVITFLNLIFNGYYRLFICNFYVMGLANLFVVIYFALLNIENKQALKKFILNDLFVGFNIYFFINIPIIIEQLSGNYFMMRFHENNSMYKDHITGLIGSSGTHELTFFWITLTIINLYRYSITKKKGLLIVTLLEILFMFIISSKNDNTAFFLIFPFIIVQYLFKYVLYASKKNLYKMFIGVILTIGAAFLIYNYNTDVKKFVDSRLIEKLKQYGVVSIKEGEKIDQEERIKLYKLAVERGNGYGFGKGIGSIESYGDPKLHRHFGMSELSMRVYEGGIIYLIALILVFTQMLNKVLALKRFKILGFIVIALNLTLLAVYSMVFRYPIYATMLSIIACVIGYNYNNEKSKDSIVDVSGKAIEYLKRRVSNYMR